jgi:hypothetical protein
MAGAAIREHVEGESLGRVVYQLSDADLRGGRVIDLLGELDPLTARELILDFQAVSDELLPRVVAVARFLGTNKRVRLAGARARQLRELARLGIEPEAILIGHWPPPRTGPPPD